LFGFPKKWQYQPHDSIDEFNHLKASSPNKQSRWHYKFFYDRYKTYDPDALSNLRLYELRATNYQKVYAERSGSIFAKISMVLLLLWVISKFIGAFVE